MGTFVFEAVIDNFLPSKDSLTKIVRGPINGILSFNLVFIVLIVVYLIQAIMQLVRNYLLAIVSKKIDISLMLSYYRHLMNIPVSAVKGRLTGEYLARFSDATTIRSAVSGATLTIMLDSTMVVFGGIILYFKSRLLFAISLIVISIYLIVILCYKKAIKTINYRIMENNSKLQSYFKETIDGIETIKANHAEEIVTQNTTRRFNILINDVLKGSIISSSQDVLLRLVETIGIVVVLWVGFYMVLNDIITVGMLLTFYALQGYFISPIKNIIKLQPMIQTAVVAAERLNDILDIGVERYDNEVEKLNIETIEYEGVSFRYSNNELTLRDINLKINEGERIAIVGESGCGKTTLVKLLLEFYIPEQGNIKINGQDISNISLGDIRRNIAYVDQNTFLFSDSIINNLKLGNPESTFEEIKEACRISKADKFINKTLLGYETYLDENGQNISGGQRQLLSIARSLVKGANIIVLDEATSNLDTITENNIGDTILDLSRELTLIIIAHKLSTIKECDRIYVMKEGGIVEHGTHKELIDKKGVYYQMYIADNKIAICAN